MLKLQPYYYEDIIFQLELNLQTVRRELIDFLEDSPDNDCDVCNRIKCYCTPKNHTLKDFILFDVNDGFEDTSVIVKSFRKEKFQKVKNINLKTNETQDKISKNKGKLILTYNNLSKNNTDKCAMDPGMIATQVFLNQMFEAAKNNNNSGVKNLPNNTIFEHQYLVNDKNSKSFNFNNNIEQFEDFALYKADYSNMPPAAKTLPIPEWKVPNKPNQIENKRISNAWPTAYASSEIGQIIYNPSKSLLNEMNYTWPPFLKSIWSNESKDNNEKEMEHCCKSNKDSISVDAFFKHFQSKNVGVWTDTP